MTSAERQKRYREKKKALRNAETVTEKGKKVTESVTEGVTVDGLPIVDRPLSEEETRKLNWFRGLSGGDRDRWIRFWGSRIMQGSPVECGEEYPSIAYWLADGDAREKLGKISEALGKNGSHVRFGINGPTFEEIGEMLTAF